MGLTSEQGRLLMLTSRLSDLQYGETMISQRRMQLDRQNETIAKEYKDKTTNMKLVLKVPDASEKSGYQKTTANFEDMVSMGYLITDASCSKLYLIPDADGKFTLPKATYLSEDKANMFDGDIYEDNGKNMVKLTSGEVMEVVDGTKLVADTTKLYNNLHNGVVFVLNTSGENTSGINLNQLEANTSFEWVQDTSDDAEAESKYNYETARIAAQDNQLDLDLKQLETQHNAVLKEMESVEKVIDNNIERTFKMFDA